MNHEKAVEAPAVTALGEPVLSADIRTVPEDFLVEEWRGFDPSGQGEHAFLEIEKRGANTAWVAQQLARWAGIGEKAVGYAGLKDRHAVTRQAFTLHLPGRELPPLESMAIEGVRVLSHARHHRKLPRGALQGNRFVLTLRNVQGERSAIEARLADVAKRGVPNWFGEQRFGHDGRNVAAARAMFEGRRVSREKRSLYLSAARSALFNQILAERIARNAWDRPLPGEVFMLDGSHSVFGPVEHDAVLLQRLSEHDIHPTGALWGRGELRSGDEVAELECRIAAQGEVLAKGLEQADLKQERRALRLPVRDLDWQWLADGGLQISFRLPAGGYATTVLSCLGTLRDASQRMHDADEKA